MKLKAKILTLVLALAMLFSVMVIATLPTSAEDTTKTVYLKPGDWDQADAWFDAWVWGDTVSGSWYKFTDSDGDGIYQISVPSGCSTMIVLRKDPSNQTNGWTWWNRTGDRTIDGELYILTNPWASFTEGNSASGATGVWTEYSYTVAGAEGLCGSSWATTDTDNDMELVDGVFTKVYEDVPAGTYEFKIVLGHSWDYAAWPSSNYSLEVTEKADVTITFTPSTGEISVDQHVHAYTSSVTSAATCTVAGEETYSCTCGDSYTEEIPATGHQNTTTTTVAATCTSAGSTTVTCDDCEATISTEEISAKGHNFEDAEIVWTVDGDYHIGSCNNGCGVTCKELHTYTDGNCKCGKEKPAGGALVETTTSVSIAANKGSLASDTSSISWAGENFTVVSYKNNSTNAIRTSDSDHFRAYKGSLTTISGANISKVVITCTGTSYMNCEVQTDGVTKTTNGTQIILTVNSGTVNAIELEGIEQWRFKNVEVTISSASSATEECVHANLSEPVTVYATCGAEGTVTTTCLDCENVVSIITTPATGEHTGHEEDYVCDVCEGVVPPAADSELTIEQANTLAVLYPNTFTEGKYYITGKITSIENTQYGNLYISDGENEFYVYGIYSADGSVRYDAMDPQPLAGDTITVYGVIGYYNSTTIEMKDGWVTYSDACVHEYLDVETPPTCTEDGYITHTCSKCDHSYTSAGDPATGHLFDNNLDTTCNNGCGHTRTLYTVNFVVPGKFTTVESISSCGTITLPTIDSIPGYYNAEEYIFAGWVAAAVDGVENATPLTGEYQPTADVTLYAAFSYSEGSGTDGYVLTDIANISDTDVVIVTMRDSIGNLFALSNNMGTTSAPAAVEITIVDGKITISTTNYEEDDLKWNIGGSADAYIFYPNGTTETWLYATNTNNGVRVGDSDNKTFKIVKGYLYNNNTTRYIGVYSNSDWRCYTPDPTTNSNSNIKNQTLGFYVYNSGSTTYYTTSPEHEHGYESSVTAPTCSSEGYTTYTCSCGDSFNDDEVPATGVHNYVDGSCSVCSIADPDDTITIFFENN